jgi:hypothetical protein
MEDVMGSMKIDENLIAYEKWDGYEGTSEGSECRLLTFSTIAAEVIGECQVPYGAAFVFIADWIKE